MTVSYWYPTSSQHESEQHDDGGSLITGPAAVNCDASTAAGGRYLAGALFLDVGSTVTSSDTINSATLTFNATDAKNDDLYVDIYALETDNPGFFSGSSGADDKSDLYTRTASASFSNPDIGTGLYAMTVTTPVSEWFTDVTVGTGDDLVLILNGKSTSPGEGMEYEGYTDAGTDEIELKIDWTAGASAAAPPPNRHPRTTTRANLIR